MKKENIIKIVSLYFYALVHDNPPKDMKEITDFLNSLGLSIKCEKVIDLVSKWYRIL